MALFLSLLACQTEKPSSTPCTLCGGECQEDVLPNYGQDHTTDPVEYEDHPPASGDHNPCWANWGVQTDTVVPPENWVHNLEHGGVVFLYNCPDGCQEDLDQLSAYVQTLPVGRALLTSYPDMDWPFAAVSWQHRLLLGCYDEDAFNEFFVQHVGRAPENLLDPPSCM